MKPTVQIAIRSLVELVLRAGDLVSGFAGSGRSLEGIRAHQKVQQSWPKAYEREVRVQHEVETEKVVLRLAGRIDGVYQDTDAVVVDEIKTTRRELGEMTADEYPIHWGQVKVYAYLIAEQRDLDRVDVQLTYYRPDTGELLPIRRRQSREELEQFFRDLIARYLIWVDLLADWERARNRSIQTLDFPFQRFRPGQRAFAVAVYQTVRDQEHCILQAATGIGKTLAALFPAVKAMERGLTRKIFYLTARTTGKALAEQALDEMRSRGLKIKSLTLTAKETICFQPEAACNPDECPYAKGHYDRIDAAVRHLFAQQAFTREALTGTAREFAVCPFEFSLDMAWWSDVIICDYNYAFDPRVYLRRFFQDDAPQDIFLVDEAHNLVDRSREMFSADISKKRFLEVRRPLKKSLPGLFKQMGRVNRCLLAMRKQCAGGFHADPQPPKQLGRLLRGFALQAERWLLQNRPAPFRDALLDLYFQATGFLRIYEGYDRHYVTCCQAEERELTVKLFCLDPSALMAEALNRCRAAVFFSATLSPGTYFRTLFGLNPQSRMLALPSPFPVEHRCIAVAAGVSTYFRDRERTAEAVVEHIATVVLHHSGNYLVYCPSYVYLQKITEKFSAIYPDIETVVQTVGMPEHRRERFIDRFEDNPGGTLVGFAVMGGVFGEGIDLVGDRLAGVVVVGVGLPALSPERDLIRSFFDAESAQGFEYAYLYPGFTRVLQAAGRVIRTDSDRGVILLIDTRFGTALYRRMMPRDWHPVYVSSRARLESLLAGFWGPTGVDAQAGSATRRAVRPAGDIS